VELPALAPTEIRADEGGERSGAVRERVLAARERQAKRLAGTTLTANADLTPRHLRRLCRIPPEAETLLTVAVNRLGLSARGHDRVLRVARTIADLGGHDALTDEHVAEAIQYRGLDRTWRP